MPRTLSDLSNEELMELNASAEQIQEKAMDAAEPSRKISQLSDEELLKLASGKDDKPSIGETIVDQAAQGLGFGFSDEVMSFGDALVEKLKGNKKDFGKLYNEEWRQRQKELKAQRKAHPGAALGAEILGGIANPLNFLLPGVGIAKTGGTLARTLGNVAVRAAAEGAVYGAGVSGQGISERLKGAAIGGTIGGVAGKTGQLIGKGLKSVGKVLTEPKLFNAAGIQMFKALKPRVSNMKYTKKFFKADILKDKNFSYEGHIGKHVLSSLIEDGKKAIVTIKGLDNALGDMITKRVDDVSNFLSPLSKEWGPIQSGKDIAKGIDKIIESFAKTGKEAHIPHTVPQLKRIQRIFAANPDKTYNLLDLNSQKTMFGEIAYKAGKKEHGALLGTVEANEEMRRYFQNLVEDAVEVISPKLKQQLIEKNQRLHALNLAKRITDHSVETSGLLSNVSNMLSLSIAGTAVMLHHPVLAGGILGAQLAGKGYGRQAAAATFTKASRSPRFIDITQRNIGRVTKAGEKYGVKSLRPFSGMSARFINPASSRYQE